MTGSKAWLPWTIEDRMERLDRFHRVIMKHAQVGFACIIKHDAFERLMRIGLAFSDTVYHLAFIGVIAATMRYHQESGLADKVDFVFDDQRHEFARALKSFRNIWESDEYLRKYLAGTPRPAVDDQVLPLQAADYMAWQIRRKIEQDRNPRMAIRRLAITSAADGFIMEAGDIPIIVDVWDDERLRLVGQNVIKDRIAALEAARLPADMRDLTHEMLVAKLRDFF